MNDGTDAWQYVYNGLGDRVQSILNDTATTYVLDLNNGLTQVLADGTNTYTYGLNRINQVSETQTGYFLGDALGSVRQVLSQEDEVLLAREYSPYGETLSSIGDYETDFSYTGEMTDGTGLVNLRARYYDPGTGRFISKDTWIGDYNNPITLVKWMYANANPIIYSDHSGNSPYVDCSQINPGLKNLCEIANGSDNDPKTIDARWKFFNRLATGSTLYSYVNMLTGKEGEGYIYAGKMLHYFLNKETSINISLPTNSSFGNDPGIIRATKIKSPKRSGVDEPESIKPLLYFFIQDFLEPKLDDCAEVNFSLIYEVNSSRTYSGSNSPRPYDRGWWGAFGHVNIDAVYSDIYYIAQNDGYHVSTQVNYQINDNYSWFPGKKTPFTYPVAYTEVQIPHEWELSLVTAGKAYMYDFTVSWTEKLNFTLSKDLSYFSIDGGNQHIELQ